MNSKWTYGNAQAFELDKSKDNWSQFYRKDGKLKAYAFACGYLERYYEDGSNHAISLSMENTVYMIKERAFPLIGFYGCFDTLGEARKALASLLA